MIIKMVNEFKLTVFHLRAQTRCKSEHARGFTAGQLNCVGFRATGPSRAVGRGPLGRGGPWAAGLLLATPKMRTGLPGLRAAGPPGRRGPWAAGRWVFGPPGRRAVAGRGPRAAGPSGRRAAGPWRAVGRGPLGRGPAFSKTQNSLYTQVNFRGQRTKTYILLFLLHYNLICPNWLSICPTTELVRCMVCFQF